MKSLETMKSGIALVVVLIFFSCSRSIYHVAYPTLHDGKYDTEFPYRNGSKELEEITQSVVRILSLTRYEDYLFAETDSLLPGRMNAEILKKAYKKRYSQTTVGGTATILAYEGQKALLLSCAHLFDKPDTIWSYFPDEKTGLPFYIQCVSVRKDQEASSIDLRQDGAVRIFYQDNTSDISLLVKEFDKPPLFPIPVFNYPIGRAADLEWGSFVYLVGYPKGRQVITKGIVSSPSRGEQTFLLDAPFNRGFSGGIILGIRDGVPNFEIVGLATSSYSDNEDVLTPESSMTYDELLPYIGPVFVKHQERINYGLSIAAPAEAIVKALKKSQAALESEGFDISRLIEKH